MSEIQCPSCGTPAPVGAVFCDNCGFDLRHVAPSSPTPIPQAAPAEIMGGENCPACGFLNVPGAVFCENCGGEMTAATAPMQSQEALAVAEIAPAQPVALTFIPGRLVIKATNVSLPIPAGKQVVVIGREDPVSGIYPDVDLDPHGGLEAGVGRQHAQLSLQGGQVYIEDLHSVNGTAVNRQRLNPKQPTVLMDGDEIRLGKMILFYSVA